MKSSTWKMDIQDRNNPGKMWMVVMTARRSSNLWMVREKKPLKPRHSTLNTTSCTKKVGLSELIVQGPRQLRPQVRLRDGVGSDSGDQFALAILAAIVNAEQCMCAFSSTDCAKLGQSSLCLRFEAESMRFEAVAC